MGNGWFRFFFFLYTSHPMHVLLRRVACLSRRCELLQVPRRFDCRRTLYRRRLAALGLPLRSILNRLRRGLVLCDQGSFVAHVRHALMRFEFGLRALVSMLPNQDRTDEMMALVGAARAAVQDL